MKMKRWLLCVAVTALMTGPASWAFAQQVADPIPYPPVKSMQQGNRLQVPHSTLMRIEALPSYSEPDWVKDLVAEGKLPPVKDRLPEKPIVVDTSSVEGVGVYGGVLRHVTGSRPQGWNWMAGLSLGSGTLDELVTMCLVRSGPTWMLTPEKVEPLPQLATSWNWSADGKQLTMELLRGAKWSDGDPFDADDVMFMWDDNISDTNVPAWVRPNAFGQGTKLEKVDAYTIRWTFQDPFPVPALFQMSFRKLCPGPSHILKPLHPKYNKSSTYDAYVNNLKPEKTPWVSMAPWTVVRYQPDQMMVLRRNPYFFEVDEKGNQLPYLDEVQYKLSSWEDRIVQTAAGSADYANLEDALTFLETMRRAQAPDFPNKVSWGPRSLSWRLDLNLSNTCGVQNERDKAVRELNRNFEFRRAVTHAMDREALGQSLVRGPFIAPYAGGLHLETDFGDPSMIVYYPYDLKSSRTLLAKLGFEDTDNDGIMNWPKQSPLAGQNLELSLVYTSLHPMAVALAESVSTMMREAGIRTILRPVNQLVTTVTDRCQWDLVVDRGYRDFQVPVANLEALAPVTTLTPQWHRGTAEAPQQLLDFEKELVQTLDAVRTNQDSKVRNELLRKYNQIATKNIYHVGLVSVPAAIVINKRFKNVPPGAPVLAYQWGEENIMRERLWVPKSEQGKAVELAPRVVPGI
jgi:peptide/nickel transport system substrate-binding protein